MERRSPKHLHDSPPGKRRGGSLSSISAPLLRLLIVLAGVLSAPPVPAEAEFPSAETEAATAPESGYIQIPYPDMTGLEPAVQEQLNEAHGDLKAWLGQEHPPIAEVAAAFGRLAKLLHAYELWEAAEAAYLNAARLDPSNLDWFYLLGYVYQKSGRLEQAAAAYEGVLNHASQLLAARVRLGEVYLAQNRPADAARELRRALELDPQNPATRARLGELAHAQGDHRRAVEILSGVLEDLPSANRLHYPLAMSYRGLGELDEAREHLAKSGAVGVTVHDPLINAVKDLATGERVHLLEGRKAFNAGRYGEAAGEFRQALAADPRSSRARVNLGSALGQMGDSLGAIEQFQAALKLDPKNLTAHYNLGILEGQRGDHEAAVRHFRAAIELKNDDGETHHRLGLVLHRLGRFEEALESLHSATLLAPTEERIWMDQAVLLTELKRYTEARKALEEAHALLPQSGAISHALARILAGCPDKEVRDGARALELAHRVFEALKTPGHAATVAMALAELDRCDEAAQWQSEAIRGAIEQGSAEWAEAQKSSLVKYQAGSPCRL